MNIRWGRTAVGALVTTLVSVFVAAGTVLPASAATELFLSEYIEGTSNNKALEIFNDTGAAVDLTAGGYNVQMFFNGSTAAGLTINLVGTVTNGDVFVLAQSSASPAILAAADQTNGAGWFNGDDAVVLRKGTTVIDSVGQIGLDPGAEWGTGLTSTADNTLRRKGTVTAGDSNTLDSFDPAVEWDGFATDTFSGLGTHQTGPPGNQPVVASCGLAVTTVQGSAASATVTATDADGTVIDVSITSVAPSDPGTFSRTAFTPAASVGGTASATLTASASTPAGSYSLTVTATNDDATPQSGTCTLTVNVLAVVPIGKVQGSVGDGDNGLQHRSPFAPATGNSAGSTTVAIQGVIYERTLARTSAGGSQNGFFIQDTAATADGDPNSSDGIFVFMGSATTLNVSGGGTYTPQAGDEIVLAGRVSEFFFLTQLSSGLSVLEVIRPGVDLDAEVAAFDIDPPDDLAAANRYWERREGMRGQVPADSIVIDSRDAFASTLDGEVWLARGDSEIAQRSDPFTRRAFRDPHPLDNDPDNLFDDGNGYRIVLGSLGLKGAAQDNTVLIAPARTFDTVNNAPVGGVYFSFDKYQIQIQQQLDLSPGVDPATNAPPQAFDRGQQYSLATYNVENLYDYRDDPFDGCDFAGNAGCPGVNPPFDYVPASQAAYEAHLSDIAQQIVTDLHGPDIVFVQEAEDQDICSVSEGTVSCGATDDADGKPDTLQELATVIASMGGPAYDAAYDRDGADDRGIVAAFLYRTDRVELLPASAGDPVLGNSPTVDYRGTALAYNTDVQNPKSLNADLPDDVDTSTGTDGTNVFTRAPQVGLFRIWGTAVGTGTSVDLYAISNHFSSTPNARVGQRTEQALYDGEIVAALQAADADVRVAVGGDFNVYPRPDDPFSPGHPLFPSDQLGPLYDQGLSNLFDALVADVPESAYSYIFQGQTQTLDQIFVTSSLLDDLAQARSAHVNADWPADFAGDGPRGASDHDPLVARFCRDLTAPSLSVSVSPSVLTPPNHKYRTVQATVSVSDDADPEPVVTLVSVTSNEPDNAPGNQDGNTVNDIVIVDQDTFRLRAERSGEGTGRIYTITYRAADACGNTTVATATVSVPVGRP
jgi:predicted extracellular nuclease